MINYNLKCNNDHEFESWFSDSKEFERLKTRKLLECIYCNSKKIKKSIMAPMISVSKNNNFWQNIAYLPQDVFIIEDTLEKNITLGEVLNKSNINRIKNSIS